MRKWVAKHASAIVSLVGVLTLIPMVTTCRMFIGWPEVPNLIFMNFLRRQGTRRKNEKESRCHSDLNRKANMVGFANDHIFKKYFPPVLIDKYGEFIETISAFLFMSFLCRISLFEE